MHADHLSTLKEALEKKCNETPALQAPLGDVCNLCNCTCSDSAAVIVCDRCYGNYDISCLQELSVTVPGEEDWEHWECPYCQVASYDGSGVPTDPSMWSAVGCVLLYVMLVMGTALFVLGACLCWQRAEGCVLVVSCREVPALSALQRCPRGLRRDVVEVIVPYDGAHFGVWINKDRLMEVVANPESVDTLLLVVDDGRKHIVRASSLDGILGILRATVKSGTESVHWEMFGKYRYFVHSVWLVVWKWSAFYLQNLHLQNQGVPQELEDLEALIGGMCTVESHSHKYAPVPKYYTALLLQQWKWNYIPHCLTTSCQLPACLHRDISQTLGACLCAEPLQQVVANLKDGTLQCNVASKPTDTGKQVDLSVREFMAAAPSHHLLVRQVGEQQLSFALSFEEAHKLHKSGVRTCLAYVKNTRGEMWLVELSLKMQTLQVLAEVSPDGPRQLALRTPLRLYMRLAIGDCLKTDDVRALIKDG